jgi:hypothetical protein
MKNQFAAAEGPFQITGILNPGARGKKYYISWLIEYAASNPNQGLCRLIQRSYNGMPK